MGTPARLRRTYFDCRFGQLHVHQAIPPGGGFDEATALLCLPGARGLGNFFSVLLAPLGNDRSIYAPDLPGSGGSDPVRGVNDADQSACAMADLLDSLRQRRVDVLAQGTGLQVALALVAQRPELVRRIGWSAASPAALARAGESGLTMREFALAAADDASIAEDALGSQLNDLLEFFGAPLPPD
jgi:pimeloyl-ACP methyl ester carboxylesterase